MRVLSFGAFVAGNTAAGLLAELGADVVKIEARARPEVVRTAAFAFGRPAGEPSGVPTTVLHAALARSTRSLSIDLHHEAARPVFRRLVAEADAVIENFAGPVLAGWEAGWSQLVAINPSLVLLSLSGYGRTGPMAGHLAYATNVAGYVGLTAAWGHAHGSHTDYVTGVTGALALAAAVRRARRDGTPTHLDVAQLDAMVGPLAPLLAGPLAGGEAHAGRPGEVPTAWLAGVFPALGDDRWLAVELEDAEDWSALCRHLGRADLATGEPGVAAGRRAELEAALRAWASGRRADDAADDLQRAGLAAEPVRDAGELGDDRQLRDRGAVVIFEHPDLGPITFPQAPAHLLAATPARMRHPGPRLGEHTGDVLREWIGLSPAEVDRLAAAGAVFDAGPAGSA
jgi:crotonobetainyl-CoA:carnitine CoA-transferase CaiB-like acyl-CoA transferase